MMARLDQASVTRVCDRVARFYDLWNRPMEWFGLAAKRRRLLARAQGTVLEVGVGTGINLDHYPPAVELTGIDVSGRMLDRARRRAGPFTRRVFGPELNRRTEENAERAGLELVEVRRNGVWREIVARPR
jgi:ubiquinone/menaquinone biosynthesis C-methylase UbiE